MNEEKLKKDIIRSIEMTESIHDEMVDTLVSIGTDSDIGELLQEAVNGMATLAWYLKRINEEELS